MKFIYLLGLAISGYYFTKWLKKKQKLHLLLSENKLTKIFQLMSTKYLQNMPRANLLTGHVQTIFLLEIANKLIKFLKRFLNIFNHIYKREEYTLSDGAVIAIDHAISLKNNIPIDNELKKILLILPGVTSSSEEFYIRIFIEDFIHEFDCKVINSRGLGGMKLYNEKHICSDLYIDTWEYIQKLCNENPEKKIFSIGFSYGGHILVRCLGENSKNLPNNFYAGCGICYPTDIEKTENFIDLNYGLYTRSISNSLKTIFLSNIENIFNEKTCDKKIFEKKNILINIMKQAKTMRDYSINYLVYVYGYKDAEEYYRKTNLKYQISKISVPFLSWFTEDDPIVPISSVPFDDYRKNTNTVTIVTEQGGHLGFYSGTLLPKRVLKEPLMNFFNLVEILKENK